MKKSCILFTILLCLAITIAQAQTLLSEGKNLTGSTALELAGGMAFLANQAGTMPTASLSLVNYFDCKERPWLCGYLEVRIIRIWPFPDPWMRMPPIVIFPPSPNPNPWTRFDLSDLEIGSGWIFAPTAGINFPVSDRFNLSVFFGGGFQYTESNETSIENLGSFRTTDATSPLLTYGVTARMGLSKGLFAKAEFQGLNTFEGNMTVIGPNNSVATFQAMRMFAPAVNVGLGVNLR